MANRVLIGTFIAFEVDGKRIELPDEAVLVTNGTTSRLLQVFYLTGEVVKGRPGNSREANKVWRMLTKRAADRQLEGRMAVQVPVRDVGRVTKVWRSGEIGGKFAAWVHEFGPGPGPMLECRPDGYRLRRAGGQYYVSHRGIMG